MIFSCVHIPKSLNLVPMYRITNDTFTKREILIFIFSMFKIWNYSFVFTKELWYLGSINSVYPIRYIVWPLLILVFVETVFDVFTVHSSSVLTFPVEATVYNCIFQIPWKQSSCYRHRFYSLLAKYSLWMKNNRTRHMILLSNWKPIQLHRISAFEIWVARA